jgi:hypothetical protein
MKKFIISIIVLGLLASSLYGGTYYLDYKIENTLAVKLNESLGQNIKYDSMDAQYFNNNITFNNVIIHDTGKPETRFNFKADTMNFHVNYRNAIMKDFQVQKIYADGVYIAFDYANKSVSNIHNIQQNLRDYLTKKKEIGIKSSVTWDVYDISLTNITINIKDYQYGEVGTFIIPKLDLPHVSSAYEKKSNADVIFIAIGKEISRLALAKSLKGKYDKYKLGKFSYREGYSEGAKVINKGKNIIYNKAKTSISNYLKKRKAKKEAGQ